MVQHFIIVAHVYSETSFHKELGLGNDYFALLAHRHPPPPPPTPTPPPHPPHPTPHTPPPPTPTPTYIYMMTSVH